ncbi:MAG: Ig-like domain-containing protein, partial [Propionibacteriaceae bacterium]|nr:Ig-like domain-containing protein [Propionibacteriaceae bacterium]
SPSKGFSGTDTCAYTAGDASGQTTTSTITVTVTPVATPDTATTTAGTPVTVLVLDNDLGSGLTLTSVTGCSHGTATIAAQGTSVVYAPAAGYSGTDSCAYAVEDTSGQTTASTITVTVTPVAVDDTATIPAGDQVTIPVLDNDQGADLMVTKVAGCAHGDAIVRDNQVVYRPGDMFSGTDTCSYDVRDGTGQTTTAVITVTVTPVAMDDDATTHADTPVTVPVLDNDRGTDLVVADSVACDYGQADIGDGGILTYTPETGRSGIATCQYEATDDSGQADTATVTITVMPVAVDDTASTTAGDPIAIPVVDNDTGTHLVVTGTTCDHGTAAIDDNTVVYQSTNEFSGTGMCAYTITDGDGLTDTARITVTVTALHADTGGAIEARGRFPLALGIALILAGAAGLTRRQAASM